MFKTPFRPIGHYVFDYKPRYYDERKERLQALEDGYKQERAENKNKKDSEYTVTLTKAGLKSEWSRNKTSAFDDKSSTYRLLLIITILCLLTWGLFNYDKILNAKQGFAKVVEAIWTSF